MVVEYEQRITFNSANEVQKIVDIFRPMHDDAYYIEKDGKYPFAIDLPVTDFQIVTETIKIDEEAEYPDFRTWAESKGSTSQDWYKHYKGGR